MKGSLESQVRGIQGCGNADWITEDPGILVFSCRNNRKAQPAAFPPAHLLLPAAPAAHVFSGWWVI